MAQRPTGGPPEGLRPARSGAVPTAEHHIETQRITVPVDGKQLPSWFWGAVGCFSVLAVGMTVLFIVIRPAANEERAGAPAAVAGPTANGRGGIQVEPMAAPVAPVAPIGAAKAKGPKAFKVARNSSRPSESTPASDKEATGADEPAEKDEPAQKVERVERAERAEKAERPEKAERAERAKATDEEAQMEEELLRPKRPRATAVVTDPE